MTSAQDFSYFDFSFADVNPDTVFEASDFRELRGLEIPDHYEEMILKRLRGWEFSLYENEDGRFLRFGLVAEFSYGAQTITEPFTLWISENEGRADMGDFQSDQGHEYPVPFALVEPLIDRVRPKR